MRILNLRGRHRAGRRLHLHQGDQQEEAADHRQVPRGVHRRRRGSRASTRRRPSELFGQIEKFAGYGFNKSHSTAYALIAYQTAYLKAHYPVEFMAALLSGDIPGRNFKSKDSLVEHLEDCQRMGVEVVPPDVNRSRRRFRRSCDGQDSVRPQRDQRLRQRRGRGDRRRARVGGPFASLFDFCERVDPQACGRATIETLIKAGAFDSLGGHRSQLHGRHRPGHAKRRRRAGRPPQRSDAACFRTATTIAGSRPTPSLPHAARVWRQRTAWPWRRKCWASTCRAIRSPSTRRRCARFCTHTSAQLAKLEAAHGSACWAACWPRSSFRTRRTRARAAPTPSTPCGTSKISTASCAASCGRSSSPSSAQLVKADAILALRASDRPPAGQPTKSTSSCNELIPLEELSSRFSSGVLIRIREDVHGGRHAAQAARDRARLPRREAAPSAAGAGRRRLRDDRCPKSGVAIDPELRRRVDELLGQGNFRIMAAARTPTQPASNGRRRALART